MGGVGVGTSYAEARDLSERACALPHPSRHEVRSITRHREMAYQAASHSAIRANHRFGPPPYRMMRLPCRTGGPHEIPRHRSDAHRNGDLRLRLGGTAQQAIFRRSYRRGSAGRRGLPGRFSSRRRMRQRRIGSQSDRCQGAGQKIPRRRQSVHASPGYQCPLKKRRANDATAQAVLRRSPWPAFAGR